MYSVTLYRCTGYLLSEVLISALCRRLATELPKKKTYQLPCEFEPLQGPVVTLCTTRFHINP